MNVTFDDGVAEWGYRFRAHVRMPQVVSSFSNASIPQQEWFSLF